MRAGRHDGRFRVERLMTPHAAPSATAATGTTAPNGRFEIRGTAEVAPHPSRGWMRRCFDIIAFESRL